MNDPALSLGLTLNVFNWNGPDFLILYGVCFVLCILWCRCRRAKILKRFEVPGQAHLSDPYEIAYLSAGGGRVALLAVVRLLAAERVEWAKKFTGARLIAKPGADAGSLPRAEQAVLDAVKLRGAKGLPVNETGQQIGTVLRSIEARLARLGLRPTASERSARVMEISWPLGFLFALGIIKVLVGASSDKPVIILVAAIIITFVMIFVVSRTGYLTASGEKLLSGLRLQNQDRRRMRMSSPMADIAGLSLGMALFGPTTLLAVSGMEYLHKDLARQMGQPGGDGGGGGCGAGGDSGCGTSGCSSGCGGGGCGGCGGGGD